MKTFFKNELNAKDYIDSKLKENKIKPEYKQIFQSLKDSDFKKIGDYLYPTIEHCSEVVRLNLGVGLSDAPKPYQVKGQDDIFFGTKQMGILPLYKAKQLDNGYFRLYELTYEAYNRFGF